MPLPLVAAREPLPAHLARERFLPSVRARVRGQVVAPAETAQADCALERLVARVDAHVAVELVGARETPLTPDYWTRERFHLHGPGTGAGRRFTLSNGGVHAPGPREHARQQGGEDGIQGGGGERGGEGGQVAASVRLLRP